MPAYEELRPFLERIDEARWYTNFGPLVGELEGALATRHRAPDGRLPHAVTVANATLGLELALEALHLERGARVLVPGLTFPASVTAILRAGLAPVVCGVDEATWLLTPASAQRALQEYGFEAAMPVATFGCPQDCAAWDEFSRNAGIPVVIDAAGAFGNQSVGEHVHVVISLHATKTLGAGEGGALLTHDAGLALRTRQLSNFGYDLATGLVVGPGTNAKMSEYHAAAALAALARWDERARVRRDLHARYLKDLQARCIGLRFQQRPAGGVYSILSVLLPPGREAREAAGFLAGQKIETRRWYCPVVPDHPAFRGLATTGDLGAVRGLGERLIGLPFHPFLEPHEMEKVVAALATWLSR